MIVSLLKSDATSVAKIHMRALKGDFLPSLGFNFLKTFYEGILGGKQIHGFGDFESSKLIGFVLGTNDSKTFFNQALRSNFFILTFMLLKQIIRNPVLIKNILETFLYPNKDIGPPAELVVIAIDDKWQGKGIGKKLTKSLEGVFYKNKIRKYKLTVHADKMAVGFYDHLGFKCISSFSLYGKMWYVYEKKLSKTAA